MFFVNIRNKAYITSNAKQDVKVYRTKLRTLLKGVLPSATLIPGGMVDPSDSSVVVRPVRGVVAFLYLERRRLAFVAVFPRSEPRKSAHNGVFIRILTAHSRPSRDTRASTIQTIKLHETKLKANILMKKIILLVEYDGYPLNTNTIVFTF